jgi:hypothetical protein
MKLNGYDEWSTSVQTTAGNTESVSATLTSSSSPAPAPTPAKSTPATVLGVVVALVLSSFIALRKRREGD